MFESYLAVPLHFTIEFLGFLVMAAGAILVVARPELLGGEASSRISASIGFGSLAVAQVLHGGSFEIGGTSFEPDGARFLVALHVLGIAFILIGVFGGLRGSNTAAAPAAAVFKEPLLLAPAVASLVLAIAALSVSARSGVKALRRLALAAFLFGISEVFMAMAPDADFGTQVPTASYVAHAVKLAALLAFASWLWTAVRSSIRTRFVASFAALLVLVVLVLASALTGVISSNVENEELKRVERQLRSVIRENQQDVPFQLQELARVAASLPETVAIPLSEGENMRPIAMNLRELGSFDVDFMMFLDRNGRVVGFSGEGPVVTRGKHTLRLPFDKIDIINVSGSPVVSEVVRRGNQTAVSPVLIGDDTVAVIAAREILLPGPGRVGAVALGRYIDALDIEDISESLAAKATLIVGNKVRATTLSSVPDIDGLVPADLDACQLSSDQQAIGDSTFYSAFGCIRAVNRQPVAMMVLSSPARIVDQTRSGLTRILFLVGMGVGMVALLLAWLSGRRITRPIQVLTATASAVREGDLSAQAPVSGIDEVGQLGETFNEMTSSLFRMTNDLREAAREEHSLRARIETIIQSMADGLVAVDAKGRVLAFNKEAENITGVKAKRALGKAIESVLDARDTHGDSIPLPIFDLAPGSVTGVFLRRKNGDLIPATIVSATLPGEEGEVAGGVAVLRDMTREREIERMKSEFLSNISHELRTPLTPIKGYAEILFRKEVEPDKVKKFVGGILESTNRLERIVQLLVDFSAMEAGRLEPRQKRIDLGPIIEELAQEWREKSPRHEVVTQVKARLPQVVVDERLIRRSLEEVLDNAVKFSPTGGKITLEAHGAESGNGERRQRAVLVSISDEGIGIPPQDIPKIFSDFQQLDGSETRTFGGLGLGLAFVQRIVEAHDGTVSVESQPEQGTRLTITIPAAKRARQTGGDEAPSTA